MRICSLQCVILNEVRIIYIILYIHMLCIYKDTMFIRKLNISIKTVICGMIFLVLTQVLLYRSIIDRELH